MTDTPNDKPESLAQSRRQHRRESFRQIWLPVYGGLVLLMVLVGGVLFLPRMVEEPMRLATLSNIMVMLVFLLPQIICLFALYLLLVVFVVGIDGFHRASTNQLQRLHHFSRTVTDKTIDVTENINKQTVDLRVKLAGFEQTMNTAFDTDQPTSSEEKKDDERTTDD